MSHVKSEKGEIKATSQTSDFSLIMSSQILSSPRTLVNNYCYSETVVGKQHDEHA